MDIDHAVEGAELAAEHSFGELFARDDASCITQEHLQQTELDASEVNLNAVHPYFARGRIELDLTDDDGVAGGRRARGSAQDGTDARDHFTRVEGLGQVVVRADFEAKDAVDVFAAGSEDQDRDRRVCAYATQHVESAHSGQHEVENDEGVFVGEHTLQAARSIVNCLKREAFRTEALAEQPAEFDVVIDDEHMIHSDCRLASDS